MPTNVDVLTPVQQALYTALTSDATLMADITGVYDHVPEGTAFPYVVIGESTQTPDNAHDRYGHRTTVTIHVWSAYHGFSEALGIAGQIVALLDHQPLTVAGLHDVSVRLDQVVTLRDPDDDLRHVPCRFAITTETTP